MFGYASIGSDSIGGGYLTSVVVDPPVVVPPIVVTPNEPPSALNLAWLKAEIVSWSHRSDLAPRLSVFIEQAECELFRELSLRSIATSTSGTASGETIAMPAGVSAIERIEIQAGGHRYTLNYSSPNGVEALTGATNRPSRFLVEGGAIRLIPAPDGPYSYTLFHLPELVPLSDTNTSNWLLANHSDLYLKAGLLQVAKYTRNMPDVQRLMQEVGAAIDSIKRADERKRFPVAGGLQIKPRSFR